MRQGETTCKLPILDGPTHSLGDNGRKRETAENNGRQRASYRFWIKQRTDCMKQIYKTLTDKLFRGQRETTGDNGRNPAIYRCWIEQCTPNGRQRETMGDNGRVTDVGSSNALTVRKNYIEPLQTSCLGNHHPEHAAPPQSRKAANPCQ